jgi:hypothetical protein
MMHLSQNSAKACDMSYEAETGTPQTPRNG